MIAIIDMNSEVRHRCFHALAGESISVAVFYSALTFVDSGALYKAELLILGETRGCRTEGESLHWASVVCPDLQTLLLNPTRLCIRPFAVVYNELANQPPKSDRCLSLDAFRMARNTGILSAPASTFSGNAINS